MAHLAFLIRKWTSINNEPILIGIRATINWNIYVVNGHGKLVIN